MVVDDEAYAQNKMQEMLKYNSYLLFRFFNVFIKLTSLPLRVEQPSDVEIR